MARTIAYLGPENTYTHLAALKRFGRGARYLHAPTVEDVFHLVERRQADCGVVPVENSLGGSVTRTLDRFVEFIDTPAKICGEIEQPIRHHLIFYPRAKSEEIRVVYSHPQAFEQCHRWLEKHLPKAVRRETNSTAEAVLYLVRKNMDLSAKLWPLRARAAIGKGELSKEYALKAIPIPQERENRTRFLILGLTEPPRGRCNKTSIVLSLKDRPGALHDALVPFKRERINLTKIESRPSKRRAWEYVFFIDLQGHASEPRVKRALKELGRRSSYLKVLGSYSV